jgi:hypothetical protein
MSWMADWYTSLANHNQKKCDSSCRHCKREEEAQQRHNLAFSKATELYNDVKDTIVAKIVASYNGGGDEGFVDSIAMLDKAGLTIGDYYDCKLEDVAMPTKRWVQEMGNIAWGILGPGFGTGDYSCSGDITLDIIHGVLLKDGRIICNVQNAKKDQCASK